MRHYDYDDEDENENVDKFFDEKRGDDEEPEHVYEDFFGDDAAEYLDQTDLEILHIALRMCEKNWFWSWRGLKYKLTMLATTYATLKRIM